MNIRRLVTGHDSTRKSIVVHDGEPPWVKHYESIPGFALGVLWTTSEHQFSDSTDPTHHLTSIIPRRNGTMFLFVTFPPDSVMAGPAFDPIAVRLEHTEKSPGLINFFEVDAPGMHKTPTVDYGIVLEGEIWLELDEGVTTHLKVHDVVVQNGTRHAWRNKSATPTKMAFVLIGDGPR